MLFRIQLINIGRGNHCEVYDINVNDKFDAEISALNTCRKYCVSRDIDIDYDENDEYIVSAGFHAVGRVRIVDITPAEEAT